MPRRRRPPRSGALTELPPLRILSQIAVLQTLFYLAALVLFAFTSFTAGTPFTMDLVFGWDGVRGDTTQGFVCAFVTILVGGFAMALAIIILITRSKLVPDFALTLHAIHLIITTLYSGLIPRNILWWLAMMCSSATCIWLGTWGCQYRELQPISFGGILGGGGGRGSTRNAASSTAGPSSNARSRDDDEESEVGFLRGTGRGRGSRGAGEYELVEGKNKR